MLFKEYLQFNLGDFNATTACCKLSRKVLNDFFNTRQQLPAAGNKMPQRGQSKFFVWY